MFFLCRDTDYVSITAFSYVSVFICLRFHITPFSDHLELSSLLRFREEILGANHFSK